MISSPPRSPSVNAVTFLFLQISMTALGTFVPPTATEFFIPYRSRFSTSARPSTTIIASESVTLGPHGISSLPKKIISLTLTACFTSSVISWLSGMFSSNMSVRMCFALFTICCRFDARISSILVISIFAMQGPILSMVSREAARTAVSVLSRLDGISIVPFDLPAVDFMFTSILPIRPVFWSSLRSRSLPNSPSVCPNIAPTTSGRSTIPSAFILEWIIYLVVSVSCIMYTSKYV